jgi:hypothetical protein
VSRGSVGSVVSVASVVVLLAGCAPGRPVPAEGGTAAGELAVSAVLTQDSRDTARDRIAVVVRNEGGTDIVPTGIEYADVRLGGPLTGERLRAVPAGGERRFPLPLVDPVCGDQPAPSDDVEPGRLTVRVGSAEVSVPATDEVGVVGRWVERRCAELEVAAVARLEFQGVRAAPDGQRADLVLTATPTGEGSDAYVIERVAGTPVFTSVGGPWEPGVTVTATGAPVEVLLTARPARCDGHVFGESAGATAFLVTVRLGGELRELLVRMSPEVAAAALDFAVEACRGRG